MNNYSVLSGFRPEEITRIREQLDAEEHLFKRGETIMELSRNSRETGIVTKGLAYLISINDSGEESILDYFEEGHVFGSAMSPDTDIDLYSVIAKKTCRVLLFHHDMLLNRWPEHRELQRKLIDGIITSVSCRSQIHIDILSQRSIRRRLMICFRYFAESCGRRSFRLPFSLSDLADYVCADRSAMMRELKSMKDCGLVESSGADITLLRS